MKKLCAGLMAASLVVLVGCNTSSTGGGGAAGGKFELKGPTLATKVKHDSTETVDIKVSPDKDFKEDVTLSAEVDPADKGVTATFKEPTVKAAGPHDAKLDIKASDKAAPGNYTVKIKGAPKKGNPTELAIKVEVPEKK